jgi:TnsA endonuclease-like protein
VGKLLVCETRKVQRLERTKPPARRIPLSRRSHITGFQPLKTGTAEHESTLERDFVTLTAFVHPTAVITSQPVTLAFTDRAVRRRYTPDFLVRQASAGANELIEVKYECDLHENWATLKPGFEAAQRWAEENHAAFRVLTDCDIRGPVLQNAKRLLPLRAAPLDTRMAMLALTQAHAMQRPTFGALLATLPDRASALATMWRLIARGALCVDLSVPITFHSELRPA